MLSQREKGLVIVLDIAKLPFGRVTHLTFHQYKAKQCIFPQASPREGVANNGIFANLMEEKVSQYSLHLYLRMNAE